MTVQKVCTLEARGVCFRLDVHYRRAACIELGTVCTLIDGVCFHNNLADLGVQDELCYLFRCPIDHRAM